MKKILVFAAIAGLIGLLASCASLPAPQSANDSLVVGRFVLSFPDGFFDQRPRTVDSWVLLHFYLPAEPRHFSVLTSYDGYFRFRSSGTGELILTGYNLTLSEYTNDYQTQYRLADSLDQRFTIQPHEVVYLGEIAVNYTRPQQVNGESIGRESYAVQNNIGVTWQHQNWDFGRSIARSFDAQGLMKYLQEKGPRSPWLKYDIVEGS
jgi:hypothetical protein